MNERRRLKGREGEYQILAPLTQSGISSVHLAQLIGGEGPQRFVVFRELLSHLAKQDDAVQQFLTQARIGARFQHPNLVRVREAGKAKTGIFSVSDYVAGDGLGLLLKAAREAGEELPPAVAAEIVAQACDGLAFAQGLVDKQGASLVVVHRNINLRNLVLGSSGQVRMVNFDVGRPPERPHPSRLTAYMSPEQCLGLDMEHPSDIFSLGVVLWEMLTGVHLFSKPDDMETRRAIIACQVPAATGLRAEVSDALSQVAAKALSKTPSDRFPSAADMAAALRQTNEASPVDAQEVGLFYAAMLGDRNRAREAMLESIEGSVDAPVDAAALLPDNSVDLPLAQDSIPLQESASQASAGTEASSQSAFDSEPPTDVVPEDLVQQARDAPVTGMEMPEPPAPEFPMDSAEAEPSTEIIAQDTAPGEFGTPPTLEDVLAGEKLPPKAEADRAVETPGPGGSDPADESAPPPIPKVRLAVTPAKSEDAAELGESAGADEATGGPVVPSLLARIQQKLPFGDQVLVPAIIGVGTLLLLIIVIGVWIAADPDDEAGQGSADDLSKAALTPSDAKPSDVPVPVPAPAPEPVKPAPTEMGALQIRTDPTKCDVSIGGIDLMGKTPMDNIIVPAGMEHEVIVRCKGFVEDQQLVMVASGERKDLQFYPDPPEEAGKRFGRLQLTTGTPVDVFLGQRRLGVTPLLGIRLPAGTHKLNLSNKSAGIKKRLSVIIQAGETTIIEEQY